MARDANGEITKQQSRLPATPIGAGPYNFMASFDASLDSSQAEDTYLLISESRISQGCRHQPKDADIAKEQPMDKSAFCRRVENLVSDARSGKDIERATRRFLIFK